MAALVITSFAMAAPMSGTFRIGTTEVSPGYTSLSAAVADINTNGISGDITLLISSDITEAANVGLGVNTNGFGITIRPDADADRTITFTSTTDNTSPSGHFVIGYPTSGLSSAWSISNTIATSNVTVNGFSTDGVTRRLKFTNSNASTANARLISIVGACQNTSIKNCIFVNMSTATASNPVCIVATVRKVGTVSTDAELAPTGLLIENNSFTAINSTVGMGMRITNSNTPLTAKATGFVFKNNIVNVQRRILELNYTTGGEIYNNELYLNQTIAPNGVIYGIYGGSGLTGTINIFNNKFKQAYINETTGTSGIRLISLASGPTAWNVYNNMFSGIDRANMTTGTAYLNYVNTGYGTGNIYNNTFYMPALTTPTNTGNYQAINNTNSKSATKIVNNIFICNDPSASFAFISDVSTTTCDYNIFYSRQTNANARFVSSYATLAAYQAANPTKDIYSKNVDVNFVDAANGDLRITGTSLQDANLSVPVQALVPSDMFGTVRASNTYAGAHEGTLPFLVSLVESIQQTACIVRTTSGIQVTLDGETAVELYAVNGMLLDKTTVSGSYSHALTRGVYIIRINGKATKFIK